MKIITSLVVALSLALPVFCQQLSQADANQILTVAKKKYRLPSIKDYYSAEDYAFMRKISELRQKLIKDNQDKPADLIAQATEYLTTEKALLKSKPIVIYKWLQNNPIVLDIKNQRGFLQIKSSDGAIDIRMRADDLAAKLAEIMAAETRCWTTYESKVNKIFPIGKFNFQLECYNQRWSTIYITPPTVTKDAFGRAKKTQVKDDQKYLLTNENLRAWYVQVAEMSAKYKAAPALMD